MWNNIEVLDFLATFIPSGSKFSELLNWWTPGGTYNLFIELDVDNRVALKLLWAGVEENKLRLLFGNLQRLYYLSWVWNHNVLAQQSETGKRNQHALDAKICLHINTHNLNDIFDMSIFYSVTFWFFTSCMTLSVICMCWQCTLYRYSCFGKTQCCLAALLDFFFNSCVCI